MRIIKNIPLVLLILFLIFQFFRPEKNQGNLSTISSFFKDTNPPEDVKLVLKESCFDCHSNYTRYPWYNKITPINYWLDSHIKHGKGNLNFSKWTAYSFKEKRHKLNELIEEVNNKTMPLKSYTWSHKEARLSDKQIKALIDWANFVKSEYE